MAAITAQMVKELREKTGAGMMDCKKALAAVEGDQQKAIDWLRQKGMAKAEKKSGRATAEGLVTYAQNSDASVAALSSLYCETDFVARGDKFQDMAKSIAETVLTKNPADAGALAELLGDSVTQLIATVGENMKVGAFVRHAASSPNEAIGHYVHANGKIGVLVWAQVGKAENAKSEPVANLLRELAMQVAATSPMAVTADGVDPKAIERERQVYVEKARAEGKPDNIVEKIADGAVAKFKKSVCLLDQPYIREEKKSVSEIVKETAKKINDTITVVGYNRIQLAAEE
ncbi:MAG: translation elongation factor Ts [Desulfovibrionaceae bacterium]|nr:translation elongation factor Ts [Desulfovibrionaceae bacterium]